MFLAGFVFPRAEYQHAAGCDAIEHTVAELVSKTSVRQKREPPEKAALFDQPCMADAITPASRVA